MLRSNRTLRALTITCAALAAVIAAAVVLTHRAAPTCRDLVVAELGDAPRYGIDLDGRKVQVKEQDVLAEVTGLFQVEVSYAVPRDLHATIFTSTYRAGPWGCSLRHSERLDLV